MFFMEHSVDDIDDLLTYLLISCAAFYWHSLTLIKCHSQLGWVDKKMHLSINWWTLEFLKFKKFIFQDLEKFWVSSFARLVHIPRCSFISVSCC